MFAPVQLEIEHVAASAGQLLRTERRRRLLSQVALADRSGMYKTDVSLLELGLRAPSLSTIIRLSGALEVSPAIFVDCLDVAWIPAGRKESGYRPAGFFLVKTRDSSAEQ
jgi:transcriptional regulator with XRE-family HTH domain